MEQTKALDALAPFLALSKAATSPRAAADLVTRATSAPGTFLFAELLETPQIQALGASSSSSSGGGPEFAPYLALLQIFSYGTWQTYQATPGLPPLGDAQALKLRQLSLVTLARDRANLSYDALQQALGLGSTRRLEDLVISAVYEGLVDAQLDPSRRAVHVNSVAPLRDLSPGAVPDMISRLRAWAGRCTATLGDLDEQMQSIRAAAAARERGKKAAQDKLQQLIGEAKESDKKRGPNDESYPRRPVNKRTMPEAGRVDAAESMEVDEPVETDKKRALRRKV